MKNHALSYGFLLLIASLVMAPVGHAANVPDLLFPDPVDTLDNGCVSLKSGIFWTFVWSDVPNATAYHLRVMGANAINPVIDNPNIRTPEFVSKSFGSYIANQNRLGWRWQVRAKVAGQWGNWSDVRQFNVEPLDTDCRSQSSI